MLAGVLYYNQKEENKSQKKETDTMTYRQWLRQMGREGRKVKEDLEQFAKRSKQITLKSADQWWSSWRYDIKVDTNGRKASNVVNELMDYIRNLCSYEEAYDGYSMWFRNFDDLAIEDDEPEDENDYCAPIKITFCVDYK